MKTLRGKWSQVIEENEAGREVPGNKEKNELLTEAPGQLALVILSDCKPDSREIEIHPPPGLWYKTQSERRKSIPFPKIRTLRRIA